MSIIKHVTLQKIVAHDFRYDPRIFCVRQVPDNSWQCNGTIPDVQSRPGRSKLNVTYQPLVFVHNVNLLGRGGAV